MEKSLEINSSPAPESIRELNTLIKISRSVISTLDYEKVLQIISNGMAELLEIESAAIYLLNTNDELLLSATTPPLDSDMPESFRKALLTDHPHILKAIQTRQSILLEDTRNAKLSVSERTIIEARQLQSLLYFPFVQEDIVMGVLILGTCNHTKKFTTHQVELGQTVANQLSVAIYNALLHDDLKRHRDNLELMVREKTHDLDEAIEELKSTNQALQEKNEIIKLRNRELRGTLKNLRATQAMLVQSEKMASLGTLTAGVAHEINNPLHYISGAYQGLDIYLKKTGDNKDKEVSLFMDAIKEGVERISVIVKGLNQFTRQTSKMDEDCVIHSILDNCLMMLNSQIVDRIDVVKLYSKKSLVIKGSIGKLNQAFINILLNAVQAIDNSGIISIRTGSNKKGSVIIEISDSGVGIREEDIKKVTDPFYTTKDPGKGTGLGLSITHTIIKEHGGRLLFDSKLGKGTTVKVVLPVKTN